jgi:hypothetical protein
MDYFVGQRVECVDVAFRPKDLPWMPNRPQRGGFYSVRGIDHRGGRGPGLLLNEISNPEIPVRRKNGTLFHMEPVFLTSRFRAATSIDVFVKMLREPEIADV